MSRRAAGGALLTPRKLCALIVRWQRKLILLDVETAALLKTDVSILNDRMWQKVVTLTSQVRAKRCVIEIGKGRDQVLGYTQLGIIEAISVVSPQWHGKRLSALLQLIGKAFAMKEAECAGRSCCCRRRRISAVHSQRVGALHPSDVLQLRRPFRDRPQRRHTVTILGR